jgi:nicotinamide-nucleotide amidase
MLLLLTSMRRIGPLTTLIQLNHAAREAARRLRETTTQLVLAESCTGGLVAASLTGVPGISQFLCGSFVVYQTDCKHAWLGVDDKLLARSGPVCRKVAEQLAIGALARTKQVTLSATITGHLGPDAPQGMDGLVFIGIARRAGKTVTTSVKRIVLPTFDRRQRLSRQRLAAIEVLTVISAPQP